VTGAGEVAAEGELSVPKTQKAPPARRNKKVNGFDALQERLQQQKRDILDMYKRDLRTGQEASDDGTEDIVDRANNSYSRELMFSLSDSERQLLLQIEEALKRLENGVYGSCVHCGDAIALPRLQAVPWARYCIDCQELQEKGMLEEA
jgi:DnaK suppressor protein